MTEAITAPRKAPAFRAERITVPAGHVLPKGNPVTRSFDLTVEYGARWHPDWAEPRVCVNAFRFMFHGDAIGFSGTSAAAFPLPRGAKLLAEFHGEPIGEFLLAYLEELGLEAPAQPEPLAAFVARPSVH